MSSPPAVHVSMAVDKGFELPLLVAMSSLALAHGPGECSVTVLHSGLDATDRQRIGDQVADRMQVDWIQVDVDLVADTHFPSYLSPAAQFRLLLPHYLPDRERTLYLDADTITVAGLGPLFATPLQGLLAAAVRDANSPWLAGPLGMDWRGVDLPPDAPYLNSGLLLIPLEEWRRADVVGRTIGLLRERPLRWGDQDGLNAVLHGRWLELPRRWNLQTADLAGSGLAWAMARDDVQAAVDDPAMIHFTERDKPWHAGSAHPARQLWLDALDKTSRAGWRPGPGGRPWHRRLGGRLKRAARELRTDR